MNSGKKEFMKAIEDGDKSVEEIIKFLQRDSSEDAPRMSRAYFQENNNRVVSL